MKTISHTVPMALCPINFKDFDKLFRLVDNDIDAALLFAKIKFHLLGSRIIKDGLVWIARSREALGAWFGFSVKKVDRLLKLLSDKGLIKKRIGLWYGQKRLYIAVALSSDKLMPDKVEINIDMLDELIKVTGSVQEALLFARLAFAYHNTKIVHQDKSWCAMTKEKLSNWLGTSIRTIHTLIESLLKKGLLIKQKFNWHNKTQCHYHIPQFIIDLIMKRNTDKKKARDERKARSQKKSTKTVSNNEQGQNCPTLSAKKALSIRLRSYPSETNNIVTTEISTKQKNTQANVKDDINFNDLTDTLSKTQEHYLKIALARTLWRENINPSSPQELWEQIIFAITNSAQLKGVQTFKHAVSRVMKIIADKNWHTPFGFYKYACNGQAFKKVLDARSQDECPKRENMTMQAPTELTAILSNFLNPQESLETKMDAYTIEAMRLVKQIKYVQANKKNGNAISYIVTRLFDKITKLILQGADKDDIMAHLSTDI